MVWNETCSGLANARLECCDLPSLMPGQAGDCSMMSGTYAVPSSCHGGTVHRWPTLLLVSLLLVCATADARLIRGGGRGSSTIIGSMQFAGTTPFLVPDPNPLDNSQAPTGANGTEDLKNVAAYGYGPVGFPISISHDWGRDCATETECFFELAESEQLSWQANIIGLPEVSSDPYLAVADLLITWTFLAVEEPPAGTFFTGPPPSEVLFSHESLFLADEFGNYGDGVGSATVNLGEDLGYQPAPDEFSTDGCYSAWPPTLGLEQIYSYGSCREVGLDLANDDGPTGAELDDLLQEGEYLALLVSAQLIAPADAQFAQFYDPAFPIAGDATLALQAGESLPSSRGVGAGVLRLCSVAGQ